MSNSIPIPEPKFLLQKVARIQYGLDNVIEVYWRYRTKQAIFHVTNEPNLADPEQNTGEDAWFIQEDGNILDSLCFYLPYHYYQLVADQIFVFEDQTLQKGKAANENVIMDIYDCEWSDFACDKLVLHMNIRVHTNFRNELDRVTYLQGYDIVD